MIGKGKKKMCVSEDKSHLNEGGSVICSRCGAQTDDKSVLCEPVSIGGDENSK
jgi:hypothetical protein